jgi:UDP-N-acetylmuramate--alanine ligase
MKFKDLHNVYFIGIGGIGMSALARWFQHMGKSVKGYDKTETVLTTKLQAEGMSIQFQDDVALIPKEVKDDKAHSLIVYTPAIPADHQEFNWLKEQGYEIMKRSQVLGLITKNMRSVAVAGTHGKTTTSSMVVHLLKSCGIDCAGFLGGISANYETNMILNDNPNAIAVIEADEFDRSFLTLHPELAVVTATDADHLDIYGDKDALKDSFRQFIKQIVPEGKLFIKNSVADDVVDSSTVEHRLYGFEGEGINAGNFKIENASFIFDYQDGTKKIQGIELNVPGYHNVENMLAAIAIAKQLGAADDSIKKRSPLIKE